MNMKKFLILGVLCLTTLVGCSTNSSIKEQPALSKEQPVSSEEALTKENTEQPAATEETPQETEETPQVAEETPAVPTVDDEADQQIKTLAGFIGKTAHDVNLALGQPATSKKIEHSSLLAANYYKVAFCNETAKVEVDFDVDSQTVNFVSFTIMAADDIEKTKDTFINVLTSLYGESTIERYLDVKGKQRRDWNDGTLDYNLNYYENNISLDIYPLDK